MEDKVYLLKDKMFEKYLKKGFKKYIVDGDTYYFPPLKNGSGHPISKTEANCIYCKNKTLRVYSKTKWKIYYQCEKCWGVQ